MEKYKGQYIKHLCLVTYNEQVLMFVIFASYYTHTHIYIHTYVHTYIYLGSSYLSHSLPKHPSSHLVPQEVATMINVGYIQSKFLYFTTWICTYKHFFNI